MRVKVAAVVLLLAVGLGTVGFVLFAPGGNAAAQNQFLTATVSRESVTQQVVATGSIRSAASYNLAFGSDPVLSTGSSSSSASSASTASTASTGSSGGSSGSWLVTNVTVAVGDSVKKGQVVASADTANAKAALDLANANLAVANARLAVDKAGLTGAERAAAFDSIRQAQQQLTVARQTQSQTSAGNDLKLSQANAALAKAKGQLAADQAAGPASATITADQSAIAAAQAQLDTLNLQISGAAAEAGVTSAQNALKLSQAQGALAAAQQRLVEDQNANPPIPSVISADQAAVAQAQQQLDTLNLQIQAANTQASVTDQQNQLKVNQAQAALTSAQAKLATDQAAGPADATIKADQAAIDAAQQQLDTLKLSISTSGSSAANQIASAELSLTSSQHTYSTRVAPADASTIATDKASVASAQSAVKTAKDTLSRSTLTSPIDGIVTAVAVVKGATAPGSADLTIASLQMEVSATVTETDYPSLKQGQAVTVSITALGQTASGTVKEIDPIGTSSGSGGVVSYPIVVAIDQAPAGIASGMSADIDVVTAQAANVLAVPATALNGSNGNYSVRVLGSDGAATAQPVQVGLITSSLAEITAGLAEGQTVVTGVNTARTGTTTATGGGGFGGGLGVPIGGGGGFRGGGNGN